MSEVLIRQEGAVGRIRLNRPKAIHALTAPMCVEMLAALQGWAGDPAIKLVLIDHAEGRGFCAGGDIRMLAESAAGNGADARAFFHVEYQLNHLIFTYGKPVVAFMDGITMGGGVGISQPARYRIATENTRFAMPETGIGLFPDVGGGWYLSRLPGRFGAYLATTGHRLDGAECMALGLASHYVEAERLPALKAELLAATERAAEILDSHTSEAPAAAVLAHRDQIDRLFASDSMEDICAALDADDSDWAKQQRAILDGKSPLSLKLCLRLLAESRTLSTFEEEMRLEYAIGSRIIEQPDFVEGVRALIVDKDNNPQWPHATLHGVPDTLIDAIVAPLSDGAAWNPAKEHA